MLYTSKAGKLSWDRPPVMRDMFSTAEALTWRVGRDRPCDVVDMGVSISWLLLRRLEGRSSKVDALLFLRFLLDDGADGETFISGVKVSGSPKRTIMLEFSSAVGLAAWGDVWNWRVKVGNDSTSLLCFGGLPRFLLTGSEGESEEGPDIA